MEFLVEHDNFTRALKVLGRFLLKNRIILKMRSKQRYEKPSEIRIRKKKESVKRIKRNKRIARRLG